MAVRLDKDRYKPVRYKPMMPGVDPVLRRRIMRALGASLSAVEPMGAPALALACGQTRRRAKACLRRAVRLSLPHVEARRIVACGDLVLAGHVPAPGDLVEAVPPVDFKALVLALRARGYTWTQIGRRCGMGVYSLSHWASGRRSPSWLGGELLLHAWQWAASGEWPPASLPSSRVVPDPGAVPAPV